MFKCPAENGVVSPPSSDDEDRSDTEMKAVAPAAGAVTHPCGTIVESSGSIQLQRVTFYTANS